MRPLKLLPAVTAILLLAYGCSATDEKDNTGGTTTATGGAGGGDVCGTCNGLDYTPCNSDGTPAAVETCAIDCAAELGCVECQPGGTVCVGNNVHRCADDGSSTDEVVEMCDPTANQVCSNGACADGCSVAADQPSNIGCEFWAVDMDQVDAFNDPASAPWGVALSNAGQGTANVKIEINNAAPGEPLALEQVGADIVVGAGQLIATNLPTREIDCGLTPNDYAAPGTCLSSGAFRITSDAPIVVYQFNVFQNAFSNDASLLLPSNALGGIYRVMGWIAGHPIPLGLPGLDIIDRSAVTIIGTQEDTVVTVKPSWRIRGNGAIAATPAGGSLTVTIGPFDVLNLETDDGTFQDDPKTVADLSGTIVQASKPVAVFSGVETTSAPGGVVDIPTYPGWNSDDTCCLDHLEDQMFPVESVGSKYVITRSPIRSTGGFVEPDVIRFLGVAEIATVTTSLPAPYDSFTINPGEVVTTWTQADFTVESDKPVMVGQILISNQYIDGPYTGDPSLTVFPPVEQYRTQYVVLTPPSWTTNHVVLSAEVGSAVTIDGTEPSNCLVTAAGTVDGKMYESRRCPVNEGVHALGGDSPFGVVAYGYGSAGSYAFAGGADVERIYDPPPLE